MCFGSSNVLKLVLMFLWFVALCWQVLTLAVTNKLSLLRPGAVPPEHETQPSAEIVRVECAKMQARARLWLSGATLCGDRACQGREMQARVRFGFGAGNPLRRSCVSSAQNAGESAF